MSGGPSHIDLFDYKPKLRRHHGQELPGSGAHGPADHGHDLGPEVVPLRRADVQVRPARPSGTWVSELLPHTAGDRRRHRRRQVAATPRRSTTIRPRPIIQTGAQQPGRPSLGAWLSYGLGSENQNLPAFVVLISQGSGNKTDQPIFSRLWGSGFLPSQHQGVRFRSRRRSGAVPLESAGHRSGHAPADARRRRPARTAWPRSRSATPRSTPVLPSTRWRSACRRRVPELTDLSNEPEAIARHVRDRRLRHRRRLRPQLPARPADGRARRALRPAHAPRLGPAQQSAEPDPRPVQGRRSARAPPWSRT